MKFKILLAALCWSCLLQAQVNTFSNNMDHDFYSMESVGNDIIMAGTVYPTGELTKTDIHVQRMDALGSVVWEMNYDIGTDERCLDLALHGTDFILLTGSDVYDNHQRIFVVRLDQHTGAFIDKVYIDPPSGSDYTEFYGLEIIYSPTVGLYYLIGEGTDGLVPHMKSQTPIVSGTGVLLCLDLGLQVLWSREINGFINSLDFNLGSLTSIEEVPGIGISVLDYAIDRGATCLLFDYFGNHQWSLTERDVYGIESMKGMYYEPTTDKLYLPGSRGWAFHLIEISNVSGGAYISNVANYQMQPNSRFWPEDIHMNHTTGRLNLFGFEQPAQGADLQNKYAACVSIDPVSLTAVEMISYEVGNIGHLIHDHAHYSRRPVLNNIYFPFKRGHTDQYTPWQGGYALLGYDYSNNTGHNAQNNYNLVLYKTDAFVRNGLHCEELRTVQTTLVTHVPEDPPNIYDVPYAATQSGATVYHRPHDQSDGCPEISACSVQLNAVNFADEGECNTSIYHAVASEGSGSYITKYVWDWGDGVIDTTYTDSASHAYWSVSPCTASLCVTVFARAPDGSECSDQLCIQVNSCNPATSLNVSTGYNEGTSTLIANNTQDDDWIVTQMPANVHPSVSSAALGQNAYVKPKHSTYDWAGPTSKYINFWNNVGGWANWPVTTLPYIYQHGFCICGDPGQTYPVNFNLALHADNWGEVYVMDGSGNPVQLIISQPYSTSMANFQNPADVPSVASLNLSPGNYSLAIIHREENGALQGVSLDGTVNSPALDKSCGFTPVLNGSFYGTTSFKDDRNEADANNGSGNSDYALYPNPASNKITIVGVEAGAQITLLDVQGGVVLTQRADGANDIDVSNLAKGMYFVTVKEEGRLRFTQKLTIK